MKIVTRSQRNPTLSRKIQTIDPIKKLLPSTGKGLSKETLLYLLICSTASSNHVFVAPSVAMSRLHLTPLMSFRCLYPSKSQFKREL